MPCRPAPCNWRKCLGSRNTVPRDRARPRSAGEGCPPDRAATGQSGSSSADRRSMCRESAGRWGAVDHCGIPGPEQGTLSEGCVARCTGQASNCGARAATSGALWQRFQRGRRPCQLQPLPVSGARPPAQQDIRGLPVRRQWWSTRKRTRRRRSRRGKSRRGQGLRAYRIHCRRRHAPWAAGPAAVLLARVAQPSAGRRLRGTCVQARFPVYPPHAQH